MRFVNSQPAVNQLTVLSILWSAKEAMYKWYGAGEVAFSQVMRTFPFELEPFGECLAAFIKGQFQQKLVLHYKLMDTLTLVWAASIVEDPGP